MNIKPLGARVLVEPFVPELDQNVGGIIIPQQAQEVPTEGKVIAVGEKVTGVTPGDIVILPKYGGTGIKADGKTYMMVLEIDIIAKCGG